MGKPQRRFGKEFAAEAVRLAGGEWSDAKGDRQGPRRRRFRRCGAGSTSAVKDEIEAPPERQEDLAAELEAAAAQE